MRVDLDDVKPHMHSHVTVEALVLLGDGRFVGFRVTLLVSSAFHLESMRVRYGGQIRGSDTQVRYGVQIGHLEYSDHFLRLSHIHEAE